MASVWVRWCLFTVLLVNFCHCFVSSLHFHIEEGEKKCFIEDIPDDTVLIGDYRIQLYDEQKNKYLRAPEDLGMFVEAKNPDDKLVLSRWLGSAGRFIFTSSQPGGHQVCLQPSSPEGPLSAGRLLTVHLDIKVGERTNNYTEIEGWERLSDLQLRVRQLREQVMQILKEQNYQRIREGHFRDVSHNTDMWMFWWPVVRSLYVVAVIMCFTGSW